MDYLKVYRSIVERGQVREAESGVYYEVHHIVPKCMGGGDEKKNLTKLTAREHFIAHWLLARIYSGHSGVVLSFWAMCNFKMTGRDFIVSSRAYEESKIRMAEKNSTFFKEMWEDPEHYRKMQDIFSSDEYKEKISKRKKELWKDPERKKWRAEKNREMFRNKEHMRKISKFSDDDIKCIRSMIYNGDNHKKVSGKYPMSPTCFYGIKNKKTYWWVDDR